MNDNPVIPQKSPLDRILKKENEQSDSQKIQKERELIFVDSGLCADFVFIDDIHHLIKVMTEPSKMKRGWKYYSFDEIESYDVSENPRVGLYQICTFSLNVKRMDRIYSMIFFDSATEEMKANQVAQKMLGTIISSKEKVNQ